MRTMAFKEALYIHTLINTLFVFFSHAKNEVVLCCAY